MEEIADLSFVKKNITNDNVTETTREFQYRAIANAPMYWPGEVPLHQVKDILVCGFDGKCPESDSNKGRLNIRNKPIKSLERATGKRFIIDGHKLC